MYQYLKARRSVKDIPQERFLQQTVEQIENATPAPALDMFPDEQFDEACRILDLKQAELREAEFRAQRLDLYTAISSLEEYEAIVENIQQKLSCLPCPSTSSEDKRSLIEYTKTLPRTRRKNRGANVEVMVNIMDIHMSDVVEDAFHDAII